MTNQNHNNHLILFDLDGTLLDVFEEHAASLERAVESVWGIPVLLPDHKRYGIPQRQTLRNVCEAAQLEARAIEDKLPEAMDKMTDVMAEILPEDLSERCLPGAHTLLEKLDGMDHVHLVIATGTLGKTAKILLDRSGLSPYFPSGAFGHECSSREQLVGLARDRGLDYYNLNPQQTRVATIGDAPADISAGKSIEAFTISVATSLFDVEALQQFEPDVVLEGLENTELVVHQMLQMHG